MTKVMKDQYSVFLKMCPYVQYGEISVELILLLTIVD